MAEPIAVMVVGASGKMGREVVKAVAGAPDLRLVAAVERAGTGQDVGEMAGLGRALGVALTEDLERALESSGAEVMVDFTRPEGLLARIMAALRHGVRPVIGTTGLSRSEVDQVAAFAQQRRLGCLIAPNFAIGALVMMRCCELAARYFEQAEIVELHHPGKVDSPSGTALKTADVIAQARTKAAVTPLTTPGAESERVAGVRGGEYAGVRLHSVRLPGLVAHQEVLFGNAGEVFTLRHDSLSRESFMPGVLLAIRKVVGLSGLVYGLDKLVFADQA
ncbi:MAG TPA: 4-hydroxy-tetrahydrodipicolinate reductase [Firmicutes bacterium]|nr:4-hydroxy-tetrahydrodipicolinate reductase [Bacillota bacterium]